MKRQISVAGTGFEDRAEIIKRYCKKNRKLKFIREPDNPHDENAIAVYILVPFIPFLLSQKMKIGYISAGIAKSLAKKMDSGVKVTGYVRTYYAPDYIDHPRVSAVIHY